MTTCTIFDPKVFAPDYEAYQLILKMQSFSVMHEGNCQHDSDIALK